MAKKSALPKSLTTVTLFSKIIALILFILLPLTAFFIGTLYQKELDKMQNPPQIITTPTLSPTSTPDSTSCNSDADCGSDSSCMSAGPLIAGQAAHKICVKKGSATPL